MDENEIIDIEICPEDVDCIDKESLPSSFEMTKNLFKDGLNIAKGALAGNSITATEELKNERWEICKGCPSLQNDRCTKCGCYMRVKVAFTATKCPIGKW